MTAVAALLAAVAAWLFAGSGARARRSSRSPGAPRTAKWRCRLPGAGGPSEPEVNSGHGPGVPRGSPGEADTPLLLDICAALLEAGLPVPRILEQLAADVPGCSTLAVVARSLDAGIAWERAWARTPPAIARLGASLAFAHLTGAPTAGLLRSAAELERRSSLRAAERRAAEMGVRLVVPLGVCVLPAFICLGIVPVVMSLLPGAG